jgi:hypothetical protein
MRRFIVRAGLAAVAAATLVAPAAAKEMSVSLASGPPTLDAGKPWTADLLVHGVPDMLKQATPGITFTNIESGETRTFDGKATGQRAADGQLLLRARVVLSEGLWEWGLTDGVTERLYEGGLVRVGDPTASSPAPAPERPAPVAAAGGEDASSWPYVLAGGVVLAAAAALAWLARRSRLQPTA